MADDSSSATGGRAASLIAEGGDLFVYGTLQFSDVMRVLLGRIPDSSAAALAGWRAAALARRPYPGLVPAAGAAHGMLVSGLTADEVELLDEYESGPYDLRKLTLADGRAAWAYVWTEASIVLPSDWSAALFAAEHLPGFVVQCRAWLADRAQASSTGRPATRSHDPEVA
ncbi:MAG: gamma-glutamylcyclotransferase family protein [Streptosporangiaceae bacterium]